MNKNDDFKHVFIFILVNVFIKICPKKFNVINFIRIFVVDKIRMI